MRSLVLLLVMAACGDDAATPLPDAPIDTPPIPAGDFSCVGQPRTMTAPDPLVIGGTVLNGSGGGIDGATVEIHNVADGSLLGSGTTMSLGGPSTYSISVASGGVAPTVYRKSIAAGRFDTYMYDPLPVYFATSGPALSNYTAKEMADYYASLGVTEDPAKASVDIIVLDCLHVSGGNPHAAADVAGVTVTVAGAEKVVYLDAQGVPQPSATATSSSGYASVLNAPAGPLTVTATAGPYTYRIGTIESHPGAFTLAYLSP